MTEEAETNSRMLSSQELADLRSRSTLAESVTLDGAFVRHVVQHIDELGKWWENCAEKGIRLEQRIAELEGQVAALREAQERLAERDQRIAELKASIPARERVAYVAGAQWADGLPGAGFIAYAEQAARCYPDLPVPEKTK